MKKQLCVLCGVREASRKGDHLPPQSLYPKPRKPNVELHKVPACQECNNPAGVDDEEFKIIIGLTTGEFRSNGAEIIDSMGRTIGFNKRLARQIFSTKKETYADRGTGILEPVVAVQFDTKAYQNVICRMVKGFYWRETGQIMDNSTVIQVLPTTALQQKLALSFRSLMDSLEPRLLNDNTFAYKYVIDDDGSSIWGMQFFGKHTVFALAEPNEHNKVM
ncbi:hypothetical protein [Vreelandella venusta]|uniref:hypothetical protein n=1 Tax=Vreelandella venusta TaxID=44935 RepID=UPI00200C89E0|nr:hypothetical protein [Halomonas venusta]UQI42168.1 hypothetical protein M3L73_07875 [Halomonas venusta]